MLTSGAVTVVLVLGSERLHSDMYKRYEGQKTSTDETITVIKLDKSGGCIDREDTFMKQTREAATREYFFGDVKRTLSPHIQQIDFSALTIYKIRDSTSHLPLKTLNLLKVSRYSSREDGIHGTRYGRNGRKGIL